jgi:hypothetical protein
LPCSPSLGGFSSELYHRSETITIDSFGLFVPTLGMTEVKEMFCCRKLASALRKLCSHPRYNVQAGASPGNAPVNFVEFRPQD